MGCFMQPLSAMDHVHVGPGITSFLIPRYSVQDTPPTWYQTDFLSNCGFTQMPSPGGCWMLQHLFRLFVRSWNVFCLHPEDWAGSPWDEGFQSQFCLYSAHSSFFFFPLLHSLITSSCAGSCLRNTGSFWGFWQRGVWKRLKSGLGNVYPSKIWLREFLWTSTLLL